MLRSTASVLGLSLLTAAWASAPWTRPSDRDTVEAPKVLPRSCPVSWPERLQGPVPVRLTRPGHFLLGQELAGVAGAPGIEIAASDVVLDLGGHTLVGSCGSGDGIRIAEGCAGVVIRNGTVSGWGGWGIDASRARGTQIERIVARGNHAGGIGVGSGGFVAATQCEGNGGTGLLATGCNAWLDDNTLTGNAVGLDVLGTDNVIIRNRAWANGRDFQIGGGNATLPPPDLVSSR